MIMMWLGFWLFNEIGGTKDSWWGFPFFVTFLVLTLCELFAYTVIWVEIEVRSKKQST